MQVGWWCCRLASATDVGCNGGIVPPMPSGGTSSICTTSRRFSVVVVFLSEKCFFQTLCMEVLGLRTLLPSFLSCAHELRLCGVGGFRSIIGGD